MERDPGAAGHGCDVTGVDAAAGRGGRPRGREGCGCGRRRGLCPAASCPRQALGCLRGLWAHWAGVLCPEGDSPGPAALPQGF